MPIKQAQAKQKAAVLKEIQAVYPGAGTGPKHNWKDSNFKFSAPSEAWLRGLKPLAALNVVLKAKPGDLFDVYLQGLSMAGKEVDSNVGTIQDKN